MKILDVNQVKSGYGPAQILHGIDLYVEQGEIVTIIGPNGCGKSTLIKTVMGHLPWAKGSIEFKGKNIIDLATDAIVKMGISYLPQLDNVFPTMTVRENLEMGGYLLSKDQLKRRVAEVTELFEIFKGRFRQQVGTMSGGERQMVGLGSALMTSPSLMLLDEPSAGLSPIATDHIFEKIKEITRNLDVTILLVEQNVFDALEISDRCYVLAMGANEFSGTPQEVINDPKIKRAYLGGGIKD